jgi:hypothetical protein
VALRRVKNPPQERIGRLDGGGRRHLRDLPNTGAEQLVEHVLGTGHRHGAVAQQAVGAARDVGGDVSGHRRHRAAELAREIARDQAAAGIGGLHDDRDAGKPRHDPVAGGKAPPEGLGARRQLGQDQTVLAHLPVQCAVTARIGDVRPTGQHRHRHPTAGQAAPVRGGVDAQGKPADDRHASRS